MFRELAEAKSFAVFLGHWYFNNPIFVQHGDISVQDSQKVVYVVESNLRAVRLVDYNASDTEFPISSLKELHGAVTSSESHVSAFSLTSPLAQFQCIERSELFDCSRPIKCHIIPKSKCEEEEGLKTDDNNLLAMSRDFHDYFDGMMTTDVNTGISDVPLIAVKPPEERDDFREEFCGEPPIKRKRVEVVVVCRNEKVGTIVGKRLKMSTETLSVTQYKTYVHVADASTFCDCLDWKYKNSCEIWNAIDDDG